MNNLTAKSTVSSTLLNVPYQLNMWIGCFILITGNLSTFGNIIVFSSKAFRNRACTVYLLAEAFVVIVNFNLVLLTRVLQKGFKISIMNRFDSICKIRYFASMYTDILALTLFILASLDRLLEAQRSPALRKWSNRTKLAYKVVAGCTIGWFLLTGCRLVLYSTSYGSCEALPGPYAIFDNYYESIVSGICPPIIILIISYLMVRSVRETIQRQAVPTVNGELNNKPKPNLAFLRNTDKQLTMMLLWQTFVAIPAFIPYAALLIYSSITANWSKSAEYVAWENVFAETIRLLSYTFFSTQFYVTLISSQGIRKQVRAVFTGKNSVSVTS
ncbi:unnamed protein product [Adineta steineri]|uniref:G-protein coupled receptors family 1 profile domain-containing protein n=1 Tax=Adineta steineri TaxID=433720 RepID=A0A815H0U4_9BILA|nr:unnamed protein product [Adineta steineri]CAF1354919.1 unnamed protein product [Adineta steineri]CAF3819456.1 unnamed protein product [Adineta steineri]CAF4011273.1 unnamed protein product [Adineta steineri]